MTDKAQKEALVRLNAVHQEVTAMGAMASIIDNWAFYAHQELVSPSHPAGHLLCNIAVLMRDMQQRCEAAAAAIERTPGINEVYGNRFYTTRDIEVHERRHLTAEEAAE